MQDTDAPKNCKGCHMHTCGYMSYSKKCPCIKCLVKVTCMNYCIEHQLFLANIMEQHKLQLQETWI